MMTLLYTVCLGEKRKNRSKWSEGFISIIKGSAEKQMSWVPTPPSNGKKE